MTDLLPFLVIGISTGSLYGLAGLGLVLTYRTSGVFNLAHGAVAAAAAYVFYQLHFEAPGSGMSSPTGTRWPWPLAALVVVGLFGPVAGVIMERLSRGLAQTRQATIIAATIGLFLLVQGLLYWHYGADTYVFPEFLPEGTAVTISGVIVNWSQVIKIAVGVASLAGVFLFLHRTRLGVTTRAVVGNDDLVSLAGTNPARVRTASWMIGCSFAALTGVLIAPIQGLDAFLLTALVVQAFGAVAVGRFTSPALTYLGGLAVGILAALAQKYLGARPPFNGIPSVVPFLVLVAMMLITPASKLPRGAGRFSGIAARPRRFAPKLTLGGTAAALGLLVAVPQVVGPRLPVYSVALIFAILFLSLSLLTRISGQISLAHAAFAGVGAATMSHFSVGAGYPWPLALLGAGLVTAAVGAVLALPAMRLSGLYLALATFGFGLFMENVMFQTSMLFGSGRGALGQGTTGGRLGARPVLGALDGHNDDTFYYLVLAIVVVSCALLIGLRRARLGRFLRAMADSPTALTTMGLGLNVTRVIVFSISAFFAGVAGALYICQIGQLQAFSFTSTYSLLYLAALTVAGAFSGFVTSAFVAAGLVFVLPSYLTSMALEEQSILFGSAAVLAALASDGRFRPTELVIRAQGRLREMVTRSEERSQRSPVRARMANVSVGTLGEGRS